MALSCSYYNIPDYCEDTFRFPLFGPGFQKTDKTETLPDGKKYTETCYEWSCQEYDGIAVFCKGNKEHGIYCAERQSGNKYGCRAEIQGDYLVNAPLVHDHRHHWNPCHGHCNDHWENYYKYPCPAKKGPGTEGGGGGQGGGGGDTPPKPSPSPAPEPSPEPSMSCTGCLPYEGKFYCKSCEKA